MGCGSSTQEEGPQNNTRPAAPSPKNTPTPSPPAQEEREEEEETGSDCLYISTDPGKEPVNVSSNKSKSDKRLLLELVAKNRLSENFLIVKVTITLFVKMYSYCFRPTFHLNSKSIL